MFITFKRIIKFGWQSFVRNKGLSFENIFIMSVALFVLTFLFVFNEVSSFLIVKAQEKVDISVYFKQNTKQEKIFEVKDKLYDKFLDKIEAINYVSSKDAKEIFLLKHQNDPLYIQALQEVGEDPFLSSLKIKAKDPIFYSEISNFLINSLFKDSIEKISYYDSANIIKKLSIWSYRIKQAGIFLNIFLGILVFLITFNTVKLSISCFKEEINTMQLVGASNWFIKGPFLIQGFLYGIFSILIINVLFFSIFSFLSFDLQNWLFNFNLLEYFKENFLIILGWQLLFIFVLGVISSYLAIQKYL